MKSAFWTFRNRNGGGDDCDAIEPRLEDYMTPAGVPEDERRQIEAHLAKCDKCRDAAQEYQRTGAAWNAFASAPTPERPGDWSAVKARLQSETPSTGARTLQTERRQKWPLLSGRSLTAAALALAAGFVAVAFPSPFRNDPGAIESHQEDQITPSFNPQAMQATVRPASAIMQARATDLTVIPAFEGLDTAETMPLIATVTNNGPEGNATFTVNVAGNGNVRTYRRIVHLPGYQKSKVTLYPRPDPATLSYGCSMTVTVSLNGKINSTPIPFRGGSSDSVIGYIGKKLGALEPRQIPGRPNLNANNGMPNGSQLPGAYATVENAPDRAIGYSGLRLLVISHDGRDLNSAQWTAIREWVKTGGAVYMMGGEDNPLLQTAEGAKLAPVKLSKTVSGKTTITPSDGAISQALDLALPADTNIEAGNRPTIIWKPLGAGSTLYTNFDATNDNLREWENYTTLWQKLSQLKGTGSLNQRQLLTLAARNRIMSENGANGLNDPFYLALPSTPTVTYFFLAYFLLAIPVTFVVLKHTRRMNLAWFTGPALAALFAAGIHLLTVQLYFMPTSRRTAGVLTLAQNDPLGHFSGYTEMFFPHAGNYKIAIPGMELLEERLKVDDRASSLTTAEDAEGNLVAPAFSVNNLAFRRLGHEQSIRLPGGITATLRGGSNGEAIASIDNQTGETLQDAIITVWRIVTPDAHHPDWRRWQYTTFTLGSLRPGAAEVVIPARQITTAIYGDESPNGNSYLQYRATPDMNFGDVSLRRPTLMAKLPGTKFGPQIGGDVSAKDSVTLVVGLDINTGKDLKTPMPTTSNPPSVGGYGGPIASDSRGATLPTGGGYVAESMPRPAAAQPTTKPGTVPATTVTKGGAK